METTADGQLQSGGAPAGAGAAAWAPHGRLLTACLVSLNVLLVLLVYLYFWRFFSRRGADAAADPDQEDAPSDDEEATSPKAMRDRREVERAIAALPVFVHSSASSVERGGVEAAVAPECAICIAEFADGEEGRLLPGCGHRFHARCVDAWFQARTTCPLCRATVLLVAPQNQQVEAAATANRTPADTDAECPPV